ncbi:MAG: hypothetical protein ACRCWB_04840 [Enterovibrio sp.]
MIGSPNGGPPSRRNSATDGPEDAAQQAHQGGAARPDAAEDQESWLGWGLRLAIRAVRNVAQRPFTWFGLGLAVPGLVMINNMSGGGNGGEQHGMQRHDRSLADNNSSNAPLLNGTLNGTFNGTEYANDTGSEPEQPLFMNLEAILQAAGYLNSTNNTTETVQLTMSFASEDCEEDLLGGIFDDGENTTNVTEVVGNATVWESLVLPIRTVRVNADQLDAALGAAMLDPECLRSISVEPTFLPPANATAQEGAAARAGALNPDEVECFPLIGNEVHGADAHARQVFTAGLNYCRAVPPRASTNNSAEGGTTTNGTAAAHQRARRDANSDNSNTANTTAGEAASSAPQASANDSSSSAGAAAPQASTDPSASPTAASAEQASTTAGATNTGNGTETSAAGNDTQGAVGGSSTDGIFGNRQQLGSAIREVRDAFCARNVTVMSNNGTAQGSASLGRLLADIERLCPATSIFTTPVATVAGWFSAASWFQALESHLLNITSQTIIAVDTAVSSNLTDSAILDQVVALLAERGVTVFSADDASPLNNVARTRSKRAASEMLASGSDAVRGAESHIDPGRNHTMVTAVIVGTLVVLLPAIAYRKMRQQRAQAAPSISPNTLPHQVPTDSSDDEDGGMQEAYELQAMTRAGAIPSEDAERAALLEQRPILYREARAEAWSSARPFPEPTKADEGGKDSQAKKTADTEKNLLRWDRKEQASSQEQGSLLGQPRRPSFSGEQPPTDGHRDAAAAFSGSYAADQVDMSNLVASIPLLTPQQRGAADPEPKPEQDQEE